MADGKTQDFQGFLSDNRVIMVEPMTPYGYRLIVEHPLTEVTCPPAVNTDTNTKELAYYGSWRDSELLGLLVGHPSHHRGRYYAIQILSPCRTRTSVDKGHLFHGEHRHRHKSRSILWFTARPKTFRASCRTCEDSSWSILCQVDTVSLSNIC